MSAEERAKALKDLADEQEGLNLSQAVDALRAAEDEALERAAKACTDSTCDKHCRTEGPCSNAHCESAWRMAERIRSLKSTGGTR